MQTTLAAILTAALIAIPLRRVVGERATTVAIIASLPYALISRADAIFVLSRWVDQPLANAIHLYDAVVPVLLIAEALSLLTRFRVRTETSSAVASLRNYVGALLTGKLNASVALLGLYGGALAFAAWVIKAWFAHDVSLIESPAERVIHALILPAVAFVATVAAVVAWRSLARAARGRRMLIGNVATLGRAVILVTTVAILSLTILIAAPRSGTLLSQAVLLVPGPRWSIEPTAAPGELRLSGKLQWGASRALAEALALDSSVRRLELNSPGGFADEGLELAKLVERHALSTVVRHECSSACTVVFISGRERVLAAGAKLGFHQGRSNVWYGDMLDDDHDKIEYLTSKGVKEDFARHAEQVPFEDMWYPSHDELRAAGVISGDLVTAPNTTALVSDAASK